uniref:Uncharacterized mitochondrial protein AtMg00810-like n=1 Tax=Nicotiana tabacum TaxID=4097 RepID=A0A1S3YME2_TOBAC|nr:PREDICTED: uncharacterized mitochondrial protein AtMg00810-like [Nicotiana tabacum]
MGSEFEISMMGELTFFLGLQVKQSLKGTLIGQQKYIKELLKRFDMEASKVIDTPIATATRLDMDEPGSPVNQTMYRGIIGSLLYLTASRPDIIFSIGLCARFQSNPKESYLNAAKRILRHLKGTHDLEKHVWSGTFPRFLPNLKGYAEIELSGTLNYRSRICSSCLLLCSTTVDQAAVGRLWIALKFTEDQIADIFTKALSREHFEKNRLALGLIKPNGELGPSMIGYERNVDTHDDYRANRQLMQYALVKRAKLTDARLVREPGSLDNRVRGETEGTNNYRFSRKQYKSTAPII